jgi:hypothetical protein
MTTSGVTSWSLTAREIVRAAMGELAAIEPGTEPDDDELQDCLLRLNAMLKSWQLRGVGLTHQTSGTVTTVAGSASGTLDAGIRSISSARLVVSSTQDRPLFAIDRTRYLSLPNKAQAGSPTMYYLSRQGPAPEIFLWPVSATATTVRIDYDRVVETVTDGAETLDIRSELQEAVYSNLALRIAGIFGAQIPPELAKRATDLERQMYDAERPDSYFFEADCA